VLDAVRALLIILHVDRFVIKTVVVTVSMILVSLGILSGLCKRAGRKTDGEAGKLDAKRRW